MSQTTENTRLIEKPDDLESQSSSKSKMNNNASTVKGFNMKYVSLVLLVVQNASLVLLTRYAKTRQKEAFINTTAVVMSEFLKLFACLVITYFEMNRNIHQWTGHLYSYLIENWLDTLKVAVPAFVYMVQNNLAYVAIANLPAATYQVSYQLKLLTAALFSVTMLNKQVSKRQWLSLLILFIGISIVQLNKSSETASVNSAEQSQFIGMVAVLCACCSSGFAGVYFEKILKGSKASLWTRNIQLGLFGFLTGLCGAYIKDGAAIQEKGFFQGYTPIVWSVICCQAFGGLLVAVVIKYADNILKGFACSISIIVSTVCAYFLFEFQITGMFCFGTIFVCTAVYMYSLPNQK